MYKPGEGLEERAVLIAIEMNESREGWLPEKSLDELGALADTAGANVVGRVIQKRDRPDPAYFVGRGKIEEIKTVIKQREANLVIFDEELTPAQLRNIEQNLQVKVIDRTGLILDIFARHARTREGKIQVELAQLRYMLPRLYGRGEALSRLGGGIGTRGPGETKLEVDRRRIGRRITALQKQLEQIRKHRQLQRKNRTLPLVSLVGYTNAGKSTLLNVLTGAEVRAEDRLFATLDPTTRKVEPENGLSFLLSDTVGFIQKLPHKLVAAFRATLEEVKEADLILHVVDSSHPDFNQQMKTVINVLRELEALEIPRLTVFNKIDIQNDSQELLYHVERNAPAVQISALKKMNLNLLLEEIQKLLAKKLREVCFLIPFDKAELISLFYQRGIIKEEEYTPNGIKIKARVEPWLAEKYIDFIDN